ncbi:hypothetical protein SKAU_G00407180 [Synaphobranchus kaupii]|uniref:Uncharacterized protein n=1 Tax=Synaphobranchus kaupii TaxID=118154 RepID=A0A9Q1EA68_SYNKA|nr:hypothetical protein SKAU_G00407180 [Synaphobranchus kaupii]
MCRSGVRLNACPDNLRCIQRVGKTKPISKEGGPWRVPYGLAADGTILCLETDCLLEAVSQQTPQPPRPSLCGAPARADAAAGMGRAGLVLAQARAPPLWYLRVVM